MRKQTLVCLAVVWTIVVVACASSAITMALCGINVFGGDVNGQTSQPLSTQEDRYQRIYQVFKTLSSDFYKKVDEDVIMLGAIEGMTKSMSDPYTFYYTPEEMSSMNRHTQGNYEGVGVLLSMGNDGLVTVARVFKGSPAEKAGMMPSDIVTSVNGVDLTNAKGAALTRATNEIQQAGKDSIITVNVIRGGKDLVLTMQNAPISVNRVEYDILDENVGYIAIYEFMGDDVQGFMEAMGELKKAGVEKLVLDLRSNPGGLLDDVVSIADQLMPEGLIVYTLDRYSVREEFFSDDKYWDVEIAVLLNSQSASASEILAGALQDSKRAVVIGEKSFGKGIVQTVIPFSQDGAGMQLTTAAYYTPSGRSIHQIGITPDIRVKQDVASYYNARENDVQLQTACNWLLNRS